MNATQGLGRRPLDVSTLPLDALTSAGYEWLCGPNATGFAWFHPRLVESLRPRQAYWLAMPDDVELDLNDEGDYALRPDLGARAFDVFGTANFFDFMPWQASVSYLVERGIDRAAGHTDGLVRRLVRASGRPGTRSRARSTTRASRSRCWRGRSAVDEEPLHRPEQGSSPPRDVGEPGEVVRLVLGEPAPEPVDDLGRVALELLR